MGMGKVVEMGMQMEMVMTMEVGPKVPEPGALHAIGQHSLLPTKSSVLGNISLSK